MTTLEIEENNSNPSLSENISTDEDINKNSKNNYIPINKSISEDDIPSQNSLSISPKNKTKKIDIKNDRYPYCIVWTPIPLITYLIPSIGHTGICTSSGIIHDFAGSYSISIDNFSFGNVTKYIQLNLTKEEQKVWDDAIIKADEIYSNEEHNLCLNNCHSHVAYALNLINYKGYNKYTMVHIWWMLILKGKYTGFLGFFKSYIGFIIICLFVYLFRKLAN